MKFFHIVMLAGAVALGFFIPDLVSSSSGVPELDNEKYCLVSTKTCEQKGAAMTLEHDFAKPLLPSRLEVVWDNAQSDTLMMSLEGLEMDMGTAKYQLTRQSNGIFAGTLLLPVCTQDKMTWLGTITDGKNEIYPAIRMER